MSSGFVSCERTRLMRSLRSAGVRVSTSVAVANLQIGSPDPLHIAPVSHLTRVSWPSNLQCPCRDEQRLRPLRSLSLASRPALAESAESPALLLADPRPSKSPLQASSRVRRRSAEILRMLDLLS